MSRCSCGRACKRPDGLCRTCYVRTKPWQSEANRRRKLSVVRAAMPRPVRAPRPAAAATSPRDPAPAPALSRSRSLEAHPYHPACLCGACTGLRWVTS